jgi:putative transposase
MVVRVGGRRMFLWRAVDEEGEVLDMLVQKRRNKAAALRLLKKLLRNQSVRPEAIVTDKLGSYGAAAREMGLSTATCRVACGRTTGRKTRTCRSVGGSESSSDSNPKDQPKGSSPRRPPIYNTFNLQPHLISRYGLRILRAGAHDAWVKATAAA